MHFHILVDIQMSRRKAVDLEIWISGDENAEFFTRYRRRCQLRETTDTGKMQILIDVKPGTVAEIHLRDAQSGKGSIRFGVTERRIEG